MERRLTRSQHKETAAQAAPGKPVRDRADERETAEEVHDHRGAQG